MRRRGWAPKFQREVLQMEAMLGTGAPRHAVLRKYLKRADGDVEVALSAFFEETAEVNDLDERCFDELKVLVGEHVPRPLLQELLLRANGSVESAADTFFSSESFYQQRIKQLRKLSADLAFGACRSGVPGLDWMLTAIACAWYLSTWFMPSCVDAS
jgi:hypothetical protein